MSKPKHVDVDLLIRQYHEGRETGEQGVLPEDSLPSVPVASEGTAADTALSGGDIEASRSGTNTGEEAVGGSIPRPEQDVVDELGKAAGITYEDAEPLRFGDKLADRDTQRWERNPASSEGYQERVQELTSSKPVAPKRPLTTRPTQAAERERGAPGRDRTRAKKT